MQCVLSGFTEMDTHFVCSRPDSPIYNGGAFALSCADKFLPFLRSGRISSTSNRYGFFAQTGAGFPPVCLLSPMRYPSQ